jgi:hypothetical protein
MLISTLLLPFVEKRFFEEKNVLLNTNQHAVVVEDVRCVRVN